MKNITFKPYSNCHPGEYWSIFFNSEVVKYPRGEREILFFLILNDEHKPLLNNYGEACYSVIVCNKSKGISPKSKITKIKKSMLSKEEYDPIDCLIELPELSCFYKRKFRVLVEKKSDLSFITKIKRSRDDEWENIEGEFDGYKKSDLKFNEDYIIKSFKKVEKNIFYKERINRLNCILRIFNDYKDNQGILISDDIAAKKFASGRKSGFYSRYIMLKKLFEEPSLENIKLFF